MRRLTHNIFVKVIAVIMSLICILLTVASAIGIFVMYTNGLYTNTYEQLKTNLVSGYAWGAFSDIQYSYVSENGQVPEKYNRSDSIYMYQVVDKNGTVIGGTWEEGTPYVAKISEESYLAPNELGQITIYIKDTIFQVDYAIASSMYWLDFGWSIRYSVITIMIISFIVWLTLFIYLCSAAGKRKNSFEISLHKVDKIPFDICTIIFFIFVLFQIRGIEMVWDSFSNILIYVLLGIVFIIDYLLFLWYSISFAVRLKTKTLIQGLLIYRMISGIRYMIKHLPLIVKTVIGCALWIITEFLLAGFYAYGGIGRVTFVIFNIFVASFIIFCAIALRKLQKGGETIANGDLSYQFDTKYMLLDFKQFAGTLNQIGIGMQKVVDEQMKSERFRAELITNVSHDIKTPITSIINYVDLIKKQPVKPDVVTEYIQVLDRQSQRLKKLTEDLIEASKASSGSIPVHKEKLDVGVLLSQAVGEFSERLEQQELEVVINKPDTPVYILADGRLLWRVFDNLVNNICKYAQMHTRVYLDLEQNNGKVSVVFRNISKFPLNISGEALTERFVRGDSSRHTEGSGLGLSIAKSLTELQQGHFRLLIDGDLFKVVIVFDSF